jgi:hypothetical protein
MTREARYWLRFQLVMAVVGAVTWYAGVFFGSEFTSGLGVGVLASALALRLLRGWADREDSVE